MTTTFETRQAWSPSQAAAILLQRHTPADVVAMSTDQQLVALNIAVNHQIRGLIDDIDPEKIVADLMGADT